MKKTWIVFLCAAVLALFLAGCSNSGDLAAEATVLPSPTAGSEITTFIGKITAKKANVFTVDVVNSTMSSTTVSDTPSPSASASPSALPTSKADVTTGVSVTVPSNAAITLSNGKAGTLSNLKVGKTVTFTMTDTVITAVTIH